MEYVSEDLINEHKSILVGVDILEKMVGMLKESGKVEIADIREIVNFFRLFADKCHHGKEEEELYPVMERYIIEKEGSPIEQMLMEHAELRKYISQMSEASGNGLKTDDFVRAAGDYIDLLRPHMEKENNVIFPFADRMLPAEMQEMLIRSFDELEEDVMGAGTHYQKLRDLFKNLKDKYLAGTSVIHHSSVNE